MAYRPVELPPPPLCAQPQGAARVRWSNPRTRGLRLAFYGALVDAVSGRPAVVRTGNRITYDGGVAVEATSAATGFRWDLQGTIPGTSPFTIVTNQLCYSSTTAIKNVVRLDDASGNLAAYFRHGSGSNNYFVAGAVSTADSFAITRSSITSPTANLRRRTVITHGGVMTTRPRFWIDGTEETTADTTGSGTRRSIARVVICNGNLSNQAFNGNVPWLYLFDREVAPDEWEEIFDNPWALLDDGSPNWALLPMAGGATTHEISIDTVAEALSELAITRTAELAADTRAEASGELAITRTVNLTADSVATAESAASITRGAYLTLDTVAFAVSEVEITIEGAGATTHQISIDTVAVAESVVAITRTAELAIDTVAEASSALALGVAYALQADTAARAESIVALGVTWQLLGVDSRALAESSVNVTIGVPAPPGIPQPPLVTSLTHVAEQTLQTIGSVRLVQATQGPPEVPFDVTVELTRPAITVRQVTVTRQS